MEMRAQISSNVEVNHDPLNPRLEFSNLGTMVYWHSRYVLGDVDGAKAYGAPEDFFEQHPEAIMLPLYLYDHSGVTMRTSAFVDPWDSGQVGYIYIDLDTMREEYGEITIGTIDLATKVLQGEVEEFDSYLRGEVYGYRVLEAGEVVDSCWGYYDEEEARDEAQNAVVRALEARDQALAIMRL